MPTTKRKGREKKAWMYEWPDGEEKLVWKRLLKSTSEALKLKESRVTITY